jgi:hypothetical protein
MSNVGGSNAEVEALPNMGKPVPNLQPGLLRCLGIGSVPLSPAQLHHPCLKALKGPESTSFTTVDKPWISGA